MSHLAVEQLQNNDELSFGVRFNQSKSIYAIRLKILKHGVLPDGNFKLSLFDGADLLAESTLTAAQINTAISGTYGMGMLAWYFDGGVRVNNAGNYEEVTAKMTVTGHTDSDSAYLALVRQHEFKANTEYGTIPVEIVTDEQKAWYSSFAMEVFVTDSN